MTTQNRTFEETYPLYSFAPLVALGLQLGKCLKAVMHSSENHRDNRGGSLPANGAPSLR